MHVTRLRLVRAALLVASLSLLSFHRAVAAGDPDLNADMRSDETKTMRMHRDGVRQSTEGDRHENKKQSSDKKRVVQRPTTKDRSNPPDDVRERRKQP